MAATQPPLDELVQRLILVQSVESARCLEEGVLTTARDADVGSILGWGFPPFRGGTISQIQGMGLQAFIAQCKQLAARHGERFNPPQRLKDMAAKGESLLSSLSPGGRRSG